MSDEDKRPGRRSEPRVWLYTEHWIFGSSRSELEADERSVWIDFLCLGIVGMGKVDITYPEQVAGQLRIPLELFERSLKKFEKYGKILKKAKKSQKKTYAFIVNWKRYQPEYLHNRPEKPTKRTRSAKGGLNDAHVAYRGERRGEEGKGEERRGEKGREGERSGGGPPSEQKTNFFKLLQSLSSPSYPFQENEDGQVFDLFTAKYPKVNIIEQTEKKVEYWRENPSALRAHKKGPRTQLVDWLLAEVDYQGGRK